MNLSRAAVAPLLFTCSTLVSTAVLSQVPTYRVGESWQFTGMQDGKPFRYRDIVESVGPDGIQIRRPGDKQARLSPSMNGFDGDNREILQVQHPLAVGKSWKYEFLWVDKDRVRNTRTAKVVAFERITVPAGSFDAYRIEAKGYWTSYSGCGVSPYGCNGNIKETSWWAPEVGRVIKYEGRSTMLLIGNGGVATVWQHTQELVKYTKAGEAGDGAAADRPENARKEPGTQDAVLPQAPAPAASSPAPAAQ